MEKSDFKKGLLNLSLISFLYLFIFMTRMIYSPLLDTIQKDFALSYQMASNIFLFISLGCGIGLLTNALSSSFIKHRTIVFLSSFLSGIACINISFCQSYQNLIISVFIMGIVNGAYFPSGFSTIASFTKKEDWGKAFAYHDLAPISAFIFAPILAEIFLFFSSWQKCVFFLGIMQILAACLFHFFGKGGNYNGESLNLKLIKSLVKNQNFKKILITSCIAASAAMGTYAILPSFLIKSHHCTREVANQILAASKFLTPFSVFAFGYITDRFGGKLTLRIYCISTGFLTCLIGLGSNQILIWAIFLQALATTSFFPTLFTFISKIYKEEERGIVVSLMAPISNFTGLGIFPFFSSILAEHHLFYLSFIILGILVFSSIFLLSFDTKTTNIQK